MIYRTFFCLNRNCRFRFTVTDNEAPPCPRCRGTRTQWIPMTTGIISGKTRGTDQVVKELQQTYGDKNWNSPRRGERAAPRLNPIAVPGRTMPFAHRDTPGWKVDMPLDPNGKVMNASYCAPTGVTVRTQAVGVDKSANRVPVDKRSITNHGAVPKFEARTSGRI